MDQSINIHIDNRELSSDSTIPTSKSPVTNSLIIQTDSTIHRTISSDSPTETDNDQTNSSSSGNSPEYESRDLSSSSPAKSNTNKLSINKVKVHQGSSHDLSISISNETSFNKQYQQNQHQPNALFQKPSISAQDHSLQLNTNIIDDDIWGDNHDGDEVEYNSDFDSPHYHPDQIEAIWADIGDDEDVTVDDVSLSSQWQDVLPILDDDIWNEEPLPDDIDDDVDDIDDDGVDVDDELIAPYAPELSAQEILDSNFTPTKTVTSSSDGQIDNNVTLSAAQTLAALLANFSSQSSGTSSTTTTATNRVDPPPPSSSSSSSPPKAYILPTLAMPATHSGANTDEMSIDDIITNLAWRPTKATSNSDLNENTQMSARTIANIKDNTNTNTNTTSSSGNGTVLDAWKSINESAIHNDVTNDNDCNDDEYAMRSQLGVWNEEGYLPEEAIYARTKDHTATDTATNTSSHKTSSISSSSAPSLSIPTSSLSSYSVTQAPSIPQSRMPVVIVIGSKGSDTQLIRSLLSQQNKNSQHTCTCIIGKDLLSESFPSGCTTQPLERDITSLFQSKLMNKLRENPYDSVLLSLCGLSSTTKHIGRLLHTLRSNSVINSSFHVCNIVSVFDYARKSKSSKLVNGIDLSSSSSSIHLRLQKRGILLPKETKPILKRFQKFKDYLVLSDLVFITSSSPHEEVLPRVSVDDWTEVLEVEAQSVNPFVHVHHIASHIDTATSNDSSHKNQKSKTNSVDDNNDVNQSIYDQFPTELLFELDAHNHENYSSFDFESLPINYKPYSSSTAKATTTTTATATATTTISSSHVKSMTPSPLMNNSKTVNMNKTQSVVLPSALTRLATQAVSNPTGDQSPLSTPRETVSYTNTTQSSQQNENLVKKSSREVSNQFISIAITLLGDMNVSTFNSVINPYFINNAQENKLYKCYGFLAFDRSAQDKKEKFVFIGIQTQLILQRTGSSFISEVDRCSRLVFIGKNLDVNILVSNLRSCVVNPNTEIIVKVAYT